MFVTILLEGISKCKWIGELLPPGPHYMRPGAVRLFAEERVVSVVPGRSEHFGSITRIETFIRSQKRGDPIVKIWNRAGPVGQFPQAPCCVTAWELYFAIPDSAGIEKTAMFPWKKEQFSRALRACFDRPKLSMRKTGAEKVWRACHSLDVVRRWGRWGEKSPVPGLHYIQPASSLPAGMNERWHLARVD